MLTTTKISQHDQAATEQTMNAAAATKDEVTGVLPTVKRPLRKPAPAIPTQPRLRVNQMVPFQENMTAITTPVVTKRHHTASSRTTDSSTQTDQLLATGTDRDVVEMSDDPILMYKGAKVSVTQQRLQLHDVGSLRNRSTAMDCLVIALDRGAGDAADEDDDEDVTEEAPLLQGSITKQDGPEINDENDGAVAEGPKEPKQQDDGRCLDYVSIFIDCCSII